MASIADVYITVLPETARLKEEIRKAVNQAERQGIKIGVKADTVDADAELKRFRTAQERNKIRQKIEFDESDLRDKMRIIGKEFDGVGAKFGSGLKLNLGLAALGTLPAAATAITNVAGALQQLAGAGVAVPGIFAGMASSMGTAALGMSGMKDAIEAVNKAADGTQASVDAANKALAGLSPNAAETVKTVVGLKGTFEDLRNIASDNMFAGVSSGLKDMVGNLLPTATRGIDGISKALNQNLLQAMNSLGSGSSQGFLDRIFGNTATAQSMLTGAIDPIIHAVGVLTAAGSDSLPRLAAAVGAVADRFNNFITGADAEGKLSKWINDGLTGFTNLGNILLNLGKSFFSITEAAGGDGGFLSKLREITDHWATFLASTEGQDKLKTFFAEGRDMLGQLKDVAVELGPILGGIFDAGISAADGWLPVIRESLNIINSIPGGAQAVVGAFVVWKTMQGPIALLNTLSNISKLLSVTLPASAATGATGISGALAKITLPAWLSSFLAAGGSIAALPITAGAFATAADQAYRNNPGNTQTSNESARARGVKGLAGVNDPAYTSPVNIPGGGGPGAQAARRGSAGYTGLPAVGPAGGVPGAQADRRGGVPVGAPQAAVDVPGVSSYVAPVVTETGGSGGSSGATDWDAIAQAESGGDWQKVDASGTHRGGLQFDQATWAQFGGLMFAPSPELATREQQISVANSVPKDQRPGRWPNTYKTKATDSSGTSSGGGATASAYPAAAPYPATSSGSSGTSGYPGDAALLASVPAGRYTQEQRGDLTQGLADCSSAVEDLVNLMDGAPTAGASMATGNAAEWLTARGFLPGSMPGAFNVGFNSEHMQATLPGGTPFNWGSNAAAARGGVGGTGAFDPAFTSHFYRPVGASPVTAAYPGDGTTTGDATRDKQIREARENVDDKAQAVADAQARIDEMNNNGTATARQRADAERDLAKAKREHADAQTDLNTAMTEGDKKSKKKDGKGGPGEQLGKDIVSGMLDVFGFGDVFKDPTEFGLFKIFKGVMGLKFADDSEGTKGGDGASLFGDGGGGGGLLGALTGFIPQPFGNLKTGGPTDAPGQFMPAMPNSSGGGGIVAPGGILADPNSPAGVPGPGNNGSYNDFRGANFGHSPTAVKQQVDSAHLQNIRQPIRSLPS